MKTDKLKHFIVGAALGLLTFPTSYFTGLWWALIISLISCSFIFVFKEIWDVYKPKPTGFDKQDILADYSGWISGAIISFIVYNAIQIIKL